MIRVSAEIPVFKMHNRDSDLRNKKVALKVDTDPIDDQMVILSVVDGQDKVNVTVRTEDFVSLIRVFGTTYRSK